jgi:hypothetical protein
MKEISERPKRPISITIISILFLIAGAIVLFWDFSLRAQGISSWDMVYTELSAVIQIVCMVGLWMMKKWAVYIYIGIAVLNQIVSLTTGTWNLSSLIPPAIILFFSLKNISKMT